MTEKEFIELWVKKLGEEIKLFPDDYLAEMIVKNIAMPGKTLLLGQELFGSFEIIDTQGNVFLQVGSLLIAKYYLYANRLRPAEIKIPESEADIEKVVKQYEQFIDAKLVEIEKDYKKQFAGIKNFHQLSNQIFHALNLQRY